MSLIFRGCPCDAACRGTLFSGSESHPIYFQPLAQPESEPEKSVPRHALPQGHLQIALNMSSSFAQWWVCTG
eukprot:gene14647-biopygen4015